MYRFGVLCPSAIGHLNPMCALALELKRRGCGIVFFCIHDAGLMLESAGLEFCIIGQRECPPGFLRRHHGRLGKMSGLAALKISCAWIISEMQMHFREVPESIRAAGVDAMLIDQVSGAGGTVAEFCGLRFVTVCNALPLNMEDSVPPFFTGWNYRKGLLARLRNMIGNRFVERFIRPAWNLAQDQRRTWRLPTYSTYEDGHSPLATICQLPFEFDFPRTKLPACFHYVGPLQEPSRSEPISQTCSPFPFERLTEKPLIYASLGTLQNKIWDVFQRIAAACAGLDAQLVISLGDPAALGPKTDLAGSPIVVSYAPHQQLIDRAALIITHAGMNTVLGALSSGVPIIAIPITNEQPGIAARLARTGAGATLPVSKLTVPRLRELIIKVLGSDSYRLHALRMKEAICSAGGVTRAADIVLQAVTTGQPVLSTARTM